MHTEILSENQVKLLPLISEFSRSYYLVGGTAIALQIGHRESVDFDLFTKKKINRKSIRKTIDKKHGRDVQIIYEGPDQLHLKIWDVKLTFFEFDFDFPVTEKFSSYIRMPDLLTLSAMKAFALGGRGKWKDYVDLYFLLKNNFTLKQISDKAEELFGNYFTEKLFREQLSFFGDVSYEEEVVYKIPPVDEEEIKKFLVETSIQQY